MGKILIVEDSEELRFVLTNIVKKEKYDVLEASNGAEALEMLKSQVVGLIFLDIGLPDINGISLIGMIKDIAPDADIVMLTGINDAMTAVNSLKAGAIDYILKPFDNIELRTIINRTMKTRLSLKRSMHELQDIGIRDIIGESREIERLKREIKMAAGVKSPVLIMGETGTGKELVARAVNNLPGNRRGIFVKVDCGTLSANLIESELFGHRRGAFTGAGQDKTGLAEIADGGTLFLDEIGNLPKGLQPKLLRIIEEETIRRVGGLKDIHVDVRIIAATNLDLENEVRSGNFREDLYYRIKVISLDVPPLRKRGNDIFLLADYYLKLFSRELKKQISGFTPEAEKAFLNHDWPG
ncbi:MAG TPA: sigma-54-dependent Fis family transcriptional regulator, partial [Nitrospirae bacterium]|nr:sigma-54-dependent Fis family transcriptional regulator [Nitrospirota bacterium]